MRKNNWIILMIGAGLFVMGCGDDGGNTDNGNDSDSELDSESDIINTLPAAVACTASNLVGTWNIDFAGDSFFAPYTEQYIFEEDGTFAEQYDDGVDVLTWEGTYEITDGRLIFTSLDVDDTYEETVVFASECVLVDGLLYVDADIVINTDPDPNSLQGTWKVQFSESEDVTYPNGTSTYSMETEIISFDVDGDALNYSETEAFVQRENDVVIEEVDATYLAATGTVRADGNYVYVTLTEIEVDENGYLVLDEESLLGIRIADGVIFGTGDPTDDPADYGYIKAD